MPSTARRAHSFSPTEDGTLETIEAIGFSDELLELYRRFTPEDPIVAAQVYSSGQPRWVESLDEMRATYPQEELALDPHLQAEAYVPLSSVRGTALGVLLVSFEGPRRLTEGEKSLFLTLGRQCAQAIVNARTFERQSRIAEELQRSLLPAELPPPQVVSSAVRYLPGSAEADVGGDWYDLVAVDEGRVGGGVGDVGGKGVLAASQMGQLRTALRAHTLEGLSPAAVLARLDALGEDRQLDLFATVVAFDIDLATGTCRYSSAGHPPPALVRRDGDRRLLDEAGSLPLGVAPAPHGTRRRGTGRPGRDAVLLHGRPRSSGRPSPTTSASRGCSESLAAHAGAEPPELVDAVLDDLVSFEGGPTTSPCSRSDPRPADGERFRGGTRSSRQSSRCLRADLRRWLLGIGAARRLRRRDRARRRRRRSPTPSSTRRRRRSRPSRSRRAGAGDVVVVVQDFGTWREPPWARTAAAGSS